MSEIQGDNSRRFERFGNGQPPTELTQESLTFVTTFDRALELGPGPGLRDAKLLASKFKALDLVDSELNVAGSVAQLPPELKDRVTFHMIPFSEFAFVPGSYDLVCAVNALPFAGASFDEVLRGIVRSMRKKAVFSGTIWTPRHAWNTPERNNNLAFRTEGEIRTLLEGLTIKSISLDEGVRPVQSGEQIFWSTYKIIAKKD